MDALSGKANNYDRDGLGAIAHLGDKGAMKKYVQSNGGYKLTDELGTSLKE